MKIKKAIYIVIGCIGVGLGAFGAVAPFIPAFPFLLVAAICFGKSSEKLDTWFKGTKLYKKNLESFLKGQGMPWPARIRVMSMVTLLMAIGFTIMLVRDVPKPALIVLPCVWLFHIIYFVFFIKEYRIVEPTCEYANPSQELYCQTGLIKNNLDLTDTKKAKRRAKKKSKAKKTLAKD